MERITGEGGPLQRGQTVPCPFCGDGGSKDDACMHMSHCGRSWCFCCGRPSGHEAGQCARGGGGCDASSYNLESNPGWNNFARGGESRGEGALQEFLRRRVAFFLRELKV